MTKSRRPQEDYAIANAAPPDTVIGMEPHTPQKLYAYVDESGQDTEGRFFVVSDRPLWHGAVILCWPGSKPSKPAPGKGRVKWRRARYAFRQAYIAGLLDMPLLAESIIWTTFRQGRNYFELTVESTARAIIAKTQGRAYRVTIFVDGLTRPEQATFTNRLRARGTTGRKCAGSAMSRAMPVCAWRTRSAG